MNAHYNNYPPYIPLLRTICNICLVTIGIITLAHIHIWLVILYCIYCSLAAFVIMPKLRCTKCFYHTRLCSTGFSLIARRFYKHKENALFKKGAWHNIFLIPIAFFPLGGGIYLLLFHPSLKHIMLLFLVALSIAAILIEHGCLGCSQCKELDQCIARTVIKKHQD
ncbi:MAG: hypothetical protein ACMUJM_06265 [bacterium]